MMTNPPRMLRLGLGRSTLLACGTTVPRSWPARARWPTARRAANGRVLVVLQLDGGNDGLNTVVPHGDDTYQQEPAQLRSKAADLKRIDDHVGLHPSLGGLAKLLEDGRLAIVQSVGYPNPNRSHFESMAIWYTARLDPGQETPGWLCASHRRRLARRGRRRPGPAHRHGGCRRRSRGAAAGPLPATVEQFRRRLGVPESAGRRRAAGRPRPHRQPDRRPGEPAPSVRPAQPGGHVRQQCPARGRSCATRASVGEYPESGLARRLRLIARLIRPGLSTPIYYTQLGGFDTHAEQLDRARAAATRARRLGSGRS